MYHFKTMRICTEFSKYWYNFLKIKSTVPFLPNKHEMPSLSPSPVRNYSEYHCQKRKECGWWWIEPSFKTHVQSYPKLEKDDPGGPRKHWKALVLFSIVICCEPGFNKLLSVWFQVDFPWNKTRSSTSQEATEVHPWNPFVLWCKQRC